MRWSNDSVRSALPDGASEDAIESANAVRLLRELLARRAPQAMVGSELAADLVERVSGLPLGIRLVADLARSVPPWQMLDRTASTLRSEIEPAFAAMLSEVTDKARAVLAAISVVPGRLDSGLIGALAGCDGIDSAVEELCEHGLLQFDDQRPDAPVRAARTAPRRRVRAARRGGQGGGARPARRRMRAPCRCHDAPAAGRSASVSDPGPVGARTALASPGDRPPGAHRSERAGPADRGGPRDAAVRARMVDVEHRGAGCGVGDPGRGVVAAGARPCRPRPARSAPPARRVASGSGGGDRA